MAKRGLSRQQLAKFLPDQDAIKAFESLFNDVQQTLPNSLDGVQYSADDAQAKAGEALAALGEMATRLSMMLLAPASQQSKENFVQYIPNAQSQNVAEYAQVFQIAEQVFDLLRARFAQIVYTPPLPYVGTLGEQNADKVAIKGGSVSGVSVDNSPIGATTRSSVKATSVNANAGVLVDGAAGIGFATGAGAGGTVAQATSKTTAVTLNKPTGQITMNNAALAAGASATFIVNNTFVANVDVVLINLIGGVASSAAYRVENENTNTGLFRIRVTNISAGSLSESLVIGFAVIKGAVN